MLPKHKGKCSRLHGHSWKLYVSVEGSIDLNTGFVMDFGDISNVVQPLVARLDHHHLGTWDPIGLPFSLGWGLQELPHDFYPTSENLLVWIAGQLDGLDLYELKRPKSPTPELLYLQPGQLVDIDIGDHIERIIYWSKLSIEETCTSHATLTREEYDGRPEARLIYQFKP